MQRRPRHGEGVATFHDLGEHLSDERRRGAGRVRVVEADVAAGMSLDSDDCRRVPLRGPVRLRSSVGIVQVVTSSRSTASSMLAATPLPAWQELENLLLEGRRDDSARVRIALA